jgi:pyruvate/2-oxoglutarate dehydrogenase complex dihydrolipoamide dehydrogenase (E3) component
MRLFSNTKLVEAFRRGNNKGIVFQHNGRLHKVLAREILFALGRIPATAGLGLERIGVRTKEGRIETNERQQTNLAHIYAAGDCSGPYQIVHIGIEQGEIAAHNVAHPAQPRSLDYRLLTNVAFTDPEVASVGLTEQEARARKIPFACAQYPLSEHGKARLMEANDGFVKLLAAPGTGEILGGTCVGPFAGDLIHEIIAAMYKRMSVFELAAMPHYHPTLAEVWTYPASQLAARIAGQRLTRRDCWALV